MPSALRSCSHFHDDPLSAVACGFLRSFNLPCDFPMCAPPVTTSRAARDNRNGRSRGSGVWKTKDVLLQVRVLLEARGRSHSQLVSGARGGCGQSSATAASRPSLHPVSSHGLLPASLCPLSFSFVLRMLAVGLTVHLTLGFLPKICISTLSTKSLPKAQLRSGCNVPGGHH